MIITICCSLDFVERIKEVSGTLMGMGHTVLLPRTAERVIKGELTQGDILNEKESGEIVNRMVRYDAIKVHCEKIKNSDGILVLNFDKMVEIDPYTIDQGSISNKVQIKNYIGGAVFLEMGFAHVFNKKIFLLNPIPDVSYKDEVVAMRPVVLDGALGKIK